MVAQADGNRQMASEGGLTRGDGASSDSTRADKEIPKGLKVWTVNERFGDIVRAIPDTCLLYTSDAADDSTEV